jgi:TP901 family phage tail tape measure protein
MSDFTKSARVTVYINGQNAATELDKLADKVKSLKSKLSAAGKDTPLGKELQKQLRESQAELEKLRDKAGLAGMSLRQLEQESRKLRAMRNAVTPGSDAFNELNGRMKVVQERINAVKSGLGPLGQAWQKVGLEVKAAAGIFVGSLLVNQLGSIVNSLGKMDDQLADVKKSANLTDAQVKQLNEELGKIQTRSSRSELRDLAYEAGKLGKNSVEDVMAFVRAADQIKIALGRDLGADAITEIGKLTNVFKLEDTFGMEKGMLMIASAINEVGAASTASESYIVDFLKRTSGVANIARITAPELIGLAGTLDSLGQTSEVSSTAISKLLTKMGAEVGTYAKLAGKSVEEFRQTMNRSGLEALLQVFDNVGKTQGGLEQLTATLGDLGVDGGRIVGVFGTLAANIDEVKRQTNLANKEFKSATSITREVEIRNQSLGTILDRIKKDFIGIWQNNEIKEGVRSMVLGLSNLIKVLKENATLIAYLASNITKAVLIWIAYKVAIIASNFALKEGTMLARAFSLASALLSGNLTKASISFKSLTAAMRANPFGVIVTAVFALDAAIKTLYNNTERQLSLEKLRAETLKSTISLTNQLESSQNAMNVAMEKFNLLTEKERENSLKLADAQIDKLALKIEELKQKRDQIAVLSNEVTPGQKAVNFIKGNLSDIFGNTNYENQKLDEVDALENSKEATKELDSQIEQLTTSINSLSKSRNQLYKNQYAEVYADEIAGKTINQLTEKISLYDQALKLATAGSADFIRISAKLAKAQKEMEKLQVTPVDEKAAEKAKKAAEKEQKNIIKSEEEKFKDVLGLLKEYQHASEALYKEITASKTKSDADIIEAERQKYDDLLSLNRQSQDGLRKLISEKNTTPEAREFLKTKLKELLLQEMAIMDQRTDAVTQMEMKLAHNRITVAQDLTNQLSQLNLTEQEQAIKAVDDKYNKLASMAADAGDIDLVTQIEEMKESAKDEVRKKYRKLQEDAERETLQKQISDAAFYANTLVSIFSGLNQIQNNNTQEELQKDKLANDQKKKNLDRQLKLKLISQTDYNSRIEKLDEEIAAKDLEARRKQAKASKLLAVFEATINTASAIAQALPNIPLSIAVGALGLTQIGIAASTKLPQFGKGTIFGGGYHSSNPSQDGNPVIDRKTGKAIATVEKGELLLSRAFVGNNPELTRLALRASQNEGGRRISPEEIYGLPSRIDTVNIRESLSPARFKNGEYFGEPEDLPRKRIEPTSDLINQFNSKLDELINEISKPKRSYVVRKDLTDLDDEDNFLKPYIEIK